MFFRKMKHGFRAASLGLALTGFSFAVQAADRADVEHFLEITGFDVALESIAHGAEDAPEMLGLQRNAFGESWRRIATEVFVLEDMHNQALDMLEDTLDQDLLEHAVAFYGSELGRRLVESENFSHMDDDDLKQIAGRQLVEMMEAAEDPKLDYFARMSDAIDPENVGLRAVQTIQVRFLLAASRAGVIRQDLDEEMLWAGIRANEEQTLALMAESAIAGAAYTYQGFTAQEIETYAEALENPKMQLVYELMNGVQYQIMGERFDDLAARLDQLRPSEEL